MMLPPQPKGGKYVDDIQIRCSRVAAASGIAADAFRAADRRRDARSMVDHLGESVPPAEAHNSFEPMKRTQSTVGCELDVRAVGALDAARKMPLGDERAAAMRQATILENAAEMHRHFHPKVGAPAK
jgi:hypothetical protein